ncbi:prepilin-type N-terminal cleavage/methylation domain-containing protein [Halomonas sp. 25-S5]|uniref:PilW family protein n=1 Tax=Halomonas sp. 25-S5 TaxID=2994065 RepID=UPI0024695A65|nr:prepilin-type N-terminal cleavage/methylation domain-containing protein [Halomonas sp. 25-S5]
MQANEKKYDLMRSAIAGQRGFSLVELLVALVIGLIIILGAGQLFLTGFLNFHQVQLLGEKQSALTYATETLIRDIRRAKTISVNAGGDELLLAVANRGDMESCSDNVKKKYAVEADNGKYSLKVYVGCGSLAGVTPQPIASGFYSSGFSAFETSSGVWELTFNLLSDSRDPSQRESLTFHAVNRTSAMQSLGS